MEIGEEVKALINFIEEESLCKGDKEPENRGWKCRVKGKGELEDPTAKLLKSNMEDAGFTLPSVPPKKTPSLGKKGEWDLDQCSGSCFPLQSHHLIPKSHLPKLAVCVWLAKNAGNNQWQLTESTNYDTDDARNGEPLPFASTTYQWYEAKGNEETEGKVCTKMMDLTGKQLHQGSHTYDDFGEEDDTAESAGYLGAVDELLKVINGQTLNHVWFCTDCNKSVAKPFKIRPLERVVASMYQASSILRTIIMLNKRFVSDRAAQFWRGIPRPYEKEEIMDSENI